MKKKTKVFYGGGWVKVEPGTLTPYAPLQNRFEFTIFAAQPKPEPGLYDVAWMTFTIKERPGI